MKITSAIKGLLKSKFALAETATDEDAKRLLDAKFLAGELTVEDILTAEKAAETASTSAVDEIVAKAVAAALAKQAPPAPTAPVAPAAPIGLTADDVTKAVNDALEKRAALGDSVVTPRDVFLAKRAGSVDVKNAIDGYSGTKTALVHTKGSMEGRQVILDDGRQGETLSERNKAVAGAYLKWTIGRALPQEKRGRGLAMTDHDWDLLNFAARNEKWAGDIHVDGADRHINGRKLNDIEVKALLNDSTSGGTYAVPLVYDDAVIQTALLYGQLWPHVNVTNLSRGNSVQAYQITRPTISANVAEGTAISLFNTASLISQLATTIYTAVGAMEFGLDFMEDAPVNVYEIIIKQYGEAAMAYLDKSVAVGDGTTQSTGIFTATGTTAVPSALGAGGPFTAGDVQSLYFGVAKAEREQNLGSTAFVGNDNTWHRLQAIPVGPNDSRRLFGNGSAGVNGATAGGMRDYRIAGEPYRTCIDCTDQQFAFCNLKRWRGYRRLGANFRYEVHGQTLALKNTGVVVMRMRVGGQPELGSAFAVMTNGANQG